jgi:restriction system protein
VARKRSSSKRGSRNGGSDGADDLARVVVAFVVVLLLTGTASTVTTTIRTWFSIWWPLLAFAGAVLIVLLVWRLRVLHRRARTRAARQAALDRQVASTDGMSGTDFEHLVARLLRRDGWHDVAVSGGSGDLGADVTAHHPGDGSLLVVQCKRYTDRTVSSPDMQRFLGTVFHHHRADHAVYVTTSYYSRPAREFGTNSGVLLLDRQALAAWMGGRPLPAGTLGASLA